ncbi:HAD hydrolase-like protein [Streptomyces sp. NPDC059866]|uniref:HAD hydrolase-like protein n=1 Tax=Streptomyces sp. NPDC059866 TaxID=3346978 RepID=UPI0036600D8E
MRVGGLLGRLHALLPLVDRRLRLPLRPRHGPGRATGESYAAEDLSRRLGRALIACELQERRRDKHRLASAEPLRPGVARLLESAGSQGIACAVVSSSERAWVRGHLDRLGVRDRFAEVVTGEQVRARKPAPDLYLRPISCSTAWSTSQPPSPQR